MSSEAAAAASAAAAADADAADVFWSVSQMMLRAARSQHDDDAAVTPSEHKYNESYKLTNSVSVRVPPSSLTGIMSRRFHTKRHN